VKDLTRFVAVFATALVIWLALETLADFAISGLPNAIAHVVLFAGLVAVATVLLLTCQPPRPWKHRPRKGGE